MKLCSCGKPLICTGEKYIVPTMKVKQYKCLYCNKTQEQVEFKPLVEVKK